MSVGANIKSGDKIYVYTMKATGEVVERVGVVGKKRTGATYMLATVDGGQRVCLMQKSGVVHNNMMWSKEPQRNVYIMKMIDILLKRRDTYEERIAATNRRLTVLKECGRCGW